MKPIIEVKNLSRTFQQPGKKAFRAVDGVSFEVYPGETLGIVGESGSGKSTIAMLMTGLLSATEGSVLVEGADVGKANRRDRLDIYSKVQMVFQNPAGSFDPRRTLGDGIGESLRNRGMSKKETSEKVKELLGQCGLPAEFADRYPHEVSGGQCQRAAIARALAVGPRVLICDEATSALDVTVQKQILELLAGLQKKNGLSYILICHNLALVQMLCDRVLVLYDGRIVEEGVPDEIIMSPKSEYTRLLVDSVL